ncbi:MAG: shikimate dehydrogenase [Candidatus Bathyarchaeota archaeon]|nr:shikimate dehydrogenase [Candidatus Bathyarchaeota archaeon]
MKPSGKTKVYGVIGDPVAHSLSPTLHNAAFAALKMDCIYLAFQVKSDELENALRGMRSLGIAGLNVTMPHKSAVIPFLDEVEPTAGFLESVNTISNNGGKLLGFSTDGIGALNALKGNGVKLSDKKILLLGGGGTAKAIAYALAAEVTKLVILNRSPQKIPYLTESLNRQFSGRVTGGLLEPSALLKNLKDADVLINATSVGMHPDDAHSLVEPNLLKSSLTVMDVVYNPLETRLVKDAKKAGAQVISGVEMLIHQGAASFEIWTGKPAPIEVMRKAALNKLVGAQT